MKGKVITAVLVTCCAIAIILFFNGHRIQKFVIIHSFKSDQAGFKQIAKYIKTSPNVIDIERTRNDYIVTNVGKGKNIRSAVSDDKTRKDIKDIFAEKHFQYIIEEGNAVYFVKNTDFQFEQGLVYSKNGKEPDWPLIYKLDLIKPQWYYYESH